MWRVSYFPNVYPPEPASASFAEYTHHKQAAIIYSQKKAATVRQHQFSTHNASLCILMKIPPHRKEALVVLGLTQTPLPPINTPYNSSTHTHLFLRGARGGKSAQCQEGTLCIHSQYVPKLKRQSATASCLALLLRLNLIKFSQNVFKF